MASTVTIDLGRNGKYAVITDAAGNQFPCTDPQEAWDVVMELAGRSDPGEPYVEPEYCDEDDVEYVDYDEVPDGATDIQVVYDDRVDEQVIYVDDDDQDSGVDFGDPVSNAAAEMAIQGGVSLFRTLQKMSYRGGELDRRVKLEEKRKASRQAKIDRMNKLRRR